MKMEQAPVDLVAAPAEPAATAVPAPVLPAPAATQPWILKVWTRLGHEPTLMLTVAYLCVSFLGLWASYWFYRGFGLPILEYMQPSDYLVAGLREPVYALLLLASVAIAWGVSFPETYRRRRPERVQALREHWWGRLVFPESRWFRWKLLGVSNETGIFIAALWGMVWASASYVGAMGSDIRAGHGGDRIVVTRSDGQPARDARLLGTSGSFVFVWWPDARVAEAIPIETVQGLVSRPASASAAGAAPVMPARTAAPKAAAGKPASASTSAEPVR